MKRLLCLCVLCVLCADSALAQDDCPAGHIRNPAVSPLDETYMLSAFKASFRGLFGRDPTCQPGAGKDDCGYYIGASNHYGVYGDDQCHAGWSGYWESWLQSGHGDLALVQTPARFLPSSNPPPTPTPTPLDLSGVQAQLAQIAATLNDHVRADGDAHAAINQNVTDGRAENKSAWDTVKPVLEFTAKYIVPAVTAYLVGKQVGK